MRLEIPRSAHWYLVIDFGGYRGSVRHSMRILPGALRPLGEMPLSSVPSLVQPRHDEMPAPVADQREFDVFISHASEDKDEVARPLAAALQSGGLRVWYDEFELRIGDSLRRKIDKGLASSRFGVVVLSKSFFAKGWPNYELDGLVTRAVSGEQVILPIWHDITKQELISYSPPLADKVARSTATHTIEEIAAEIIELIDNAGYPPHKALHPTAGPLRSISTCELGCCPLFADRARSRQSPGQMAALTIQKRGVSY